MVAAWPGCDSLTPGSEFQAQVGVVVQWSGGGLRELTCPGTGRLPDGRWRPPLCWPDASVRTRILAPQPLCVPLEPESLVAPSISPTPPRYPPILL